MDKNETVLELTRRRTRAGRGVAFILIFGMLFIGLYVVYQYQMSVKHGHSYGKVLSKMLAPDKESGYLCKIRLENGVEVSAACYSGIVEGSRVNIMESEPQKGVVIYRVDTP
jgi:hypothetical protein